MMKNIASLFIDEHCNEKFSLVISVENSKGIKNLKNKSSAFLACQITTKNFKNTYAIFHRRIMKIPLALNNVDEIVDSYHRKVFRHQCFNSIRIF